MPKDNYADSTKAAASHDASKASLPHCPKRVTIISGHFGSGKTNIAVNYAMHLCKAGYKTALADLDTVNPYFRTKDSENELTSAGVRVVSVNFANTNADIPSVPAEIYSLLRSKDEYAVLDVGGDDMGAYVLGGMAQLVKNENSFEHFFVVNFCRPLTPTAEEAAEYMKEIELACKIPFTGIINNSNLGEETTPETVLVTAEKAALLEKMTGKRIVMTTAETGVAAQIKDENIFPLELQKKYW